MSTNFTNLLVGWSSGQAYAGEKIQEDEVKQGKNYYLSSLNIFGQLTQLGVLISTINKHLAPHSLTNSVQVLCNIAPFLNLPFSLFCAAVKQGEYEKLAKLHRQARYAFIPFPEKLSDRAVSFFNFFAEHTGNIIRVTMITASIGLIVLGNTAYGGAVLTALAYQTIDHMGFVPRRISLFMETYMPTVSLIGMLVGGTLLTRVISVLELPTHVIPSTSRYLHQKLDAFIRLFFNLSGPTLKEIDAPLVRRDEMTFDEIDRILNDANPDHYKISPAHCAKSTIDLNQWPTDYAFEKYLSLFDGINWESKYNFVLVRNKLKDDEIFIDFLLKEFPGTSEKDLKANIDHYIRILATNKGWTPEKYAADWTRQQMVQLIKVLKGDVRVKGSQKDLDEAIRICAILLPYFSSLKNQAELEDALLKLAIEGGDYCARGIKGASNELLSGILEGGIQQGEKTQGKKIGDPNEAFELKILQALQNYRSATTQLAYQKIVQKLGIPQGIAKDKHGFDLYRFYLSLGCFPMTQFERNRVGFPEIIGWEFYSSYRKSFYDLYKMDLEEIIEKMNGLDFTTYLERIITTNTRLSPEDKDRLLTKIIFAPWDANGKTLKGFHRLLLVRMGVLIHIQ